MSALKGLVFDRFRQFQGLSPELQAQVTSLTESLASDQAKVFTKTTVGLLKSVPQGIKGKSLIEKIVTRLQSTDAANANAEHAKKLAQGLVLSGALTSYQEDPASNADEIQDNEVYVPFGKPLTNEKTVSSVREGAIQAGLLKRKVSVGVFSGFSSSIKDAYVVANDQTKAVYVFDSELARSVVKEINLEEASVQFESSIEHGIRLSNVTQSEIFSAPTKELAEEWLNSFINAGAKYREAFNLDNENVKSFYDLKDYDMQRNEIKMDKYKGKVVLVVNVSSLCGLTPTNYPELTALDEKYRAQGLEILAFPCNQFASQEPGSHEEIMEFVKQYNCQFPFFEKADVNGKNARPVFTYLKSQLPGSFGNFVKWNFTKFLIDRNGKPFKRYAPKELPFSFEEDIKTLLAQQPATETAAATATTTTTEQ